VLVVCLIAVGLYRGWFIVSRPAHEAGGDKINVNASVDVKKMRGDIEKVEKKISGAVQPHEKQGEKAGTIP
jgi:hypothetical protein